MGPGPVGSVVSDMSSKFVGAFRKKKPQTPPTAPVPDPVPAVGPAPEEEDVDTVFSASPTVIELPPRVVNQSPASSNPFAVLRRGLEVVRTIARSGIGLENKIKEIPVLELLDEVVCLFIFFTVPKPGKVPPQLREHKKDDVEAIPETYMYKELLDRAFKIHKTDLISIISRICTVVDTSLMICATLWDGVDYSTLINPLDISVRLARLKGLENSYAAGNLDLMAAEDSTVLGTVAYENEVMKLVSDITSLIQNRAVKPAAETAYMQYLTSATKLKSVIVMAVRCRTEKDVPYMIGLYGKPGVGKSMLSEIYMTVVGLAYKTPIRVNDIWLWAPDSNGWHTGATTSKKILQVTEHDNIKREDNSNQIFFDMARMCDTLPSPYNKPDLETKGIAVNMLIGGVFCCNQQDFGITRVKDPGASARRIDFFEVLVKPEFGKKCEAGTHLVPDVSKCRMVYNAHEGKPVPDEDTYILQPYTFQVTENLGDTSGGSRQVKIVPVGPSLSVPEWRKYMYKRAKRKLKESRNYAEKLGLVRTLALCKECANPHHSCLCGPQGCNFRPHAMYYKDITTPVTWSAWFVEQVERITEATRGLSEANKKKRALLDAMLERNSSQGVELPDLPTLPPQHEETDSVEYCDASCVENEAPKAYQLRFAEGGKVISCRTNVPIKVNEEIATGVTGFLGNVVRRFTKSCVSSVLHAFFNIYTSIVVAAFVFPFMPILSPIVFIVMLGLTASVETTSAILANRLVAKKADKGEPIVYWDTTYSELALTLGLMTVAGFGLSALVTSSRSKRRKALQSAPSEDLSEVTEDVADEGFEPQTPEELIVRQKQPDIWLQREPIAYKESVPHDILTMTYDQVVSVIRANMIRLSTWDPVSKEARGQTQAFMVNTNVMILPVHDHEVVENRPYAIIRKGTGNITICHFIRLVRIQCNGQDTDLCFGLINISLPVRNVRKMITHDYCRTFEHAKDRVVKTMLMTSNGDYPASSRYGPIYTETRSTMGFVSDVAYETVSGDCCSPLITTEAPFVLLGFHVSRVVDSKRTYSSIVQKFEYDIRFTRALKPEEKKLVGGEFLFFDNSILTCPRPKDDDPSRRVCTRFLRNEGAECTATPPSVLVIGHNASTRVSAKSQVYLSPLSPHLEAAGWARLHGPPPLNANRAAAAALQYGSRGARPRTFVLNEALIAHYVAPIVEKLRILGKKPRMLSYDEAVRGMYDNSFVKPMSLSKACGGGFPGKKRSRMVYTCLQDEDEPGMVFAEIETGEYTFYVDKVPEPETQEESTECAVVDRDEPIPSCNSALKGEVEQILRCWEAGVTCNTVVQAALKDDPTLLSKIAEGNGYGRTVTSQSTAHHIAQRIVFTDLCGALKAIPFTSGCYEGVSYRSEDWMEIAEFHLMIGDPEVTAFLDADTKKMDLSFNQQDLYSTTEALAQILEGCGAEPRQIKLARSCGFEMSLPILNLYGEWLMMSMNTSGNNLTVTYNNISGVQLRTREAYVAFMIAQHRDMATDSEWDFYEIERAIQELPRDIIARILEDFHIHVRVGSIGDDSLMSTILPGFNMGFITAYFRQKGVQITGSDKGGPLLENLRLRDLSCCQRGFYWHPELDRIVGPLNIKSLSRSLHCMLPSAEHPSVIERAIMTSVLEELSLHGREVYDERLNMLIAASLSSGRPGFYSDLFKSYEVQIEIMATRHPTTMSEQRRQNIKTVFFHRKEEGLANLSGLTRVALQPDRLPHLDMAQEEMRHPVVENERGEQDHAPNPQNLICVSNQSQINNVELITPSSTVDATTVAATESAERRSIYTSDTPTSTQTRPIKLFTLAWSIDTVLTRQFDPWSMLLSNPVIRQKMNNFRYFRGNLVIQVFIDGNQFHSGECWLGYLPLPLVDEITEYDNSTYEDLVEFSQRPRVSISPRNSQGGRMVLPFIYHHDFVDLLSDQISELGRLYVRSIVPLRMANGGTQPATLTFMAHFEDLTLCMPTTHNLPVLKVVNESTITSTEGTGRGNDAVDLSMQSSTLTTSPQVMWQRGENRSFKEIAGKECFIGTYMWESSAAPERTILSLRCSPFHGMVEGTGITAEYHITPSTWCSLPFTYWRGCCEYRFEVICSSQHRGKLFFVWDPLYTVSDGAYNKNYMAIVDIGTKTTHTVRVGWGQSSAFLPTITGMSQIVGQSIPEYSNAVPYANGVLTVGVFSPLILPSEETATSVHINVYQRMDSIELALLREPLAAMSPQKNSVIPPSTGTATISPPVTAPVTNPTLTTTRVLEICEEPMPYVYVPKTRSNLVGTFLEARDQTYTTALADKDLTRIRLNTTGTYQLSKSTTLVPEFPYAFTFRGFVEGGTTFSITTSGVPNPLTVTTQLTGITDVKDAIITPLEEGTRFLGEFTVNGTSRVETTRVGLRLPRWEKRVVRSPAELPTFIDLTPFVNWYGISGAGDVGTLLTDQNPGGRSGCIFKIRIPNPELLLGNVVVSYIGNSTVVAEPMLMFSPIDGITHLVNAASGERRHHVYNYAEAAYFPIPPTATISILQVAWISRRADATRSAVKAQPVLVTNQSGLSDVTTFGPACTEGLHSPFL
nr:hypothetical protein [Hubei picorna-like virus 7]